MRSGHSRKGMRQPGLCRSSFILAVVAVVAYALFVHCIFEFLEQRLTEQHLIALDEAKPNNTNVYPAKKVSDMEAIKEASLHSQRITYGLTHIFLEDKSISAARKFKLQLDLILIQIVLGGEISVALKDAEKLWNLFHAALVEHPSFSTLESVVGFRSVALVSGVSPSTELKWLERQEELVQALQEQKSALKSSNRIEIVDESQGCATWKQSLSQKEMISIYTVSHEAERVEKHCILSSVNIKTHLPLASTGEEAEAFSRLLSSSSMHSQGIQDRKIDSKIFLDNLQQLWIHCSTSSNSSIGVEWCHRLGEYYKLLIEKIKGQLLRTVLLFEGQNLTFLGDQVDNLWIPILDTTTCELVSVLAMGAASGVHRDSNLERTSEDEVIDVAEAIMNTCLKHRRNSRVQLLMHSIAFDSSYSSYPVFEAANISDGVSSTSKPRHHFTTVLMRNCYALYIATEDSTYGHIARELLERVNVEVPQSLELRRGDTLSFSNDSDYIDEYLAQQRYFILLFTKMECSVYRRKARGICALFQRSTISSNGYPILLEKGFGT